MGNGERSGSGDRGEWPVRLATGLGTCAGAAVALLLRRDLGSFWLGLLAFVLVTGLGGLLGRLVGGLLFRSPDRRPPGPPPHA
jgi:ABC-type nickel/cobalt efflux system permease component RcnA